jgi:hypothetical protein
MSDRSLNIYRQIQRYERANQEVARLILDDPKYRGGVLEEWAQLIVDRRPELRRAETSAQGCLHPAAPQPVRAVRRQVFATRRSA